MENVLIVDDEEDIRELMSETIARWGYNPIVAMDGDEALAKFKELSIDLMLTDVRMPKTDGITLLEKVKAIDSSISVIVFTGYPNIQSAVNALKIGADDYLVKPVDLAELKAKIARAITTRRQHGSYSIIKSINWAMLISIPLWLLLAYLLARSL